MAELRLSEIWIYPIKSLGGFRVNNSRVLEKGLEHDRRMMLVDAHGNFMTQRKYPQLALLHVSMNGKLITVKHTPSSASIDISLGFTDGHGEQVTIWDDVVQAVEVNASASTWFSDQLHMNCRLVFFPETNARPVDKLYAVSNENVSLADGYPFLIIGQASLDDLNSRLKEAITIQRFRPNFVFTGGQPYEEDSWKQFAIGTNRFTGVKNCKRCVLTTVNPDTGETGEEPLQTLSTYRKRSSKVYFGQNAVALDYLYVNEGDPIKF